MKNFWLTGMTMDKYTAIFQYGIEGTQKEKRITLYADSEREARACAKQRIRNELRGAKCLIKKI